MTRRFTGDRLVIASHNKGKLEEFSALLAPLRVSCISAADLGLPEPEETETTFVGNARIKAKAAALASGLPALADDSGLVVDALGGAPGIYSARYAGPGAGDRANIDKLLAKLRDVAAERRTARFVCALALLHHPADPTPLICQGSWEGIILTEPHGEGGFGYDPIFFVPTENRTAAELEPAIKNRLSHRGQALAQLARWLKLDPVPLATG